MQGRRARERHVLVRVELVDHDLDRHQRERARVGSVVLGLLRVPPRRVRQEQRERVTRHHRGEPGGHGRHGRRVGVEPRGANEQPLGVIGAAQVRRERPAHQRRVRVHMIERRLQQLLERLDPGEQAIELGLDLS